MHIVMIPPPPGYTQDGPTKRDQEGILRQDSAGKNVPHFTSLALVEIIQALVQE
jgi:hypothetical protein